MTESGTTNKKPTIFWPKSEWTLNSQSVLSLSTSLYPFFESIVEKEKLGKAALQQFNDLYLPLTHWIATKHNTAPIILGINGAQGSGKSTLCKIISVLLTHGFNKSVLQLSIDDLYLSKKKRQQLGLDIHPLLKTRGVPGTHDVALGISILSSLREKKQLNAAIKIPCFDKAQDDVLAEKSWRKVNKNVDIILFEGWCVGATAQTKNQLNHATNELEEKEDKQGVWRNYVNDQLGSSYKALFEFFDYQIMLKVPDMASVFEWRSLQEKKLALSCKQKNLTQKCNIMSAKELEHFIMHFERITKASLQDMPAIADVVLALNKKHQVCDIKFNNKKQP